MKNIRVPQLSRKELLKVAKDELADIDGSYEDLIYDYSVLQSSFEEEEKKGGEILCCAVERKLLTSYIELFDATGIRLKSVDISINALHTLTQELADLNGKPILYRFWTVIMYPLICLRKTTIPFLTEQGCSQSGERRLLFLK